MTLSSPRCEERESRHGARRFQRERGPVDPEGPGAERKPARRCPLRRVLSCSERAEHQEYYVNERNSSHRGTKSIARTPRGRSDRMLSLSPNSRLYTALVFSSVLE